MSLIAFKLILPPILILLASLVGRRWGDAIGGWLVGLPLTSGPVAAFLAIQYGPDFAATATNGSLAGTAGQASFCLTYALLARRGWVAALFGGAVAYTVAALFAEALSLPHWGYYALALVALTTAVKFIPHQETERSSIAAPWWDLPARMIVATTLILTLTSTAAIVGPTAAGVLSSFPVFVTILTVFAHRLRGPVMATQVLRGMVLALFGFATFFFLLGLLLVPAGIVTAFLAATASALFVQAGALHVIRRANVPRAA